MTIVALLLLQRYSWWLAMRCGQT